MSVHSKYLALRSRRQIEAEIERYLDRVSALIARLDSVDVPTEDMEEDDPSFDPLDLAEREEWRIDGIVFFRPVYGIDQTLGPRPLPVSR